MTGHDGEVTSVRFAPDGKYIASGSHDMTIHVWDASSGTEVQKMTGREAWVTVAAS